jgi:thiazole synthase
MAEDQQKTRVPRKPAPEGMVRIPGGGLAMAPSEPIAHGAGEHRPTSAHPPQEETERREAPRTVAEVEADPDLLQIADQTFRSRLIVGTGKYPSNEVMVGALRASGAQVITVAVRRVDLDRSQQQGILHHLDAGEFFLLANTAGCYTADEAVRYARIARAAGFNEWLKLEVIGDERTLLPDTVATVEAARELVAEGFKVMAYTNDDVVSALRLEDAGCVAVMPLASPIGSGLGVVNPYFIREIKRRLTVPVIVDAGVGTASDACIAMEQGMDGVLMNTAIAAAHDPVAMAEAMKHGVRAGRLAYLAGRMQPREIAVPSSPTRGMLD